MAKILATSVHQTDGGWYGRYRDNDGRRREVKLAGVSDEAEAKKKIEQIACAMAEESTPLTVTVRDGDHEHGDPALKYERSDAAADWVVVFKNGRRFTTGKTGFDEARLAAREIGECLAREEVPMREGFALELEPFSDAWVAQQRRCFDEGQGLPFSVPYSKPEESKREPPTHDDTGIKRQGGGWSTLCRDGMWWAERIDGERRVSMSLSTASVKVAGARFYLLQNEFRETELDALLSETFALRIKWAREIEIKPDEWTHGREPVKFEVLCEGEWLGMPLEHGARSGLLTLEAWKGEWHVVLGNAQAADFGPGKNIVLAGPRETIDALTREWIASIAALAVSK